MDKEVVLGIVRHVLTTLAGVLVADGYLQNSDATAIVGGLVAAVGVAWSWYNKHQHAAEVKKALLTPVPPTSPGVKQ